MKKSACRHGNFPAGGAGGRRQAGFVLVATLVVLLLLIVLGVSITTNSSLELQVAGNEVRYQQAFYAADAGVQSGIAALTYLFQDSVTGTITNLNPLLENHCCDADNGCTPSDYGIDCSSLTDLVDDDGNTLSGINDLNEYLDTGGGRVLGSAQYSLTLVNNSDDPSGSMVVDGDGILLLTSTGSLTNRTSTQISVQARLEIDKDYAQEHYDTSNSGNVNTSVDITNVRRTIDESLNSYK